MSNQAYLNNIKQGAIQGWHTHKILPSLTGAQAALESGWGSSKLSKPPYNNNFGIKAGNDWTGRTVIMSTQEWVGGRYITINDSFRAYDSLSDSVKDHAAFFTNTPWRTQNYRNVVGERDYKRVAQAVSSAGYATDPSYASKIIRIIEENNLYNWDQEAFNGNVANSGSTQENTNQEKTVGKDISTAAKTTTEDYTITVIGDSLGVGTEPFLKQLKWSKANYDNYGSRQWTHSTKIYSAIDILRDLSSAGSLNNNVIFILGTNRGVDASEIDTAVGIIGRDRNIILVDTASEVNHRNTVSNRYKEASKRHENVFYANWSDKARPNIASWYYADGAGGTRIHMNSTGYKKHADFIVQAIYEVNATNWEKEINTPTQKSEEYIDIYNIEYDDGKYTSPKGDSSIYNAELNQQYGFKPRKGEIMWIERIYEGNEDNPSDLLEGALRFMEEHSVPGAQYTVNMRYLPEDIAIGDTGIFVDHEFNPPLYIEARVLEINTSVSNPESDSVVLGNVIEVHPKDKSDILSIQKELQKTQEDFKTEFWKEKPVNLEMLTSNGLHLSTDNYIPKNELNRYKYDHVKVENGTGIVHLTAPRDPENDFTFYGHIADNYIDAVDELVDEIINVDGEEIIFDEPIDPNTNPQGPDVLDPNDLGEIRELKVKEFDVEFLDILGRKIGEDTIQVYEDSTFSYKVSGYTKSINKINILSTSSFILDVVSFKEDDDYKSPFADKTRLYVKAIQEAEDVTYKFKNFIWTRVSDNQRSDEEWNDINKWNETSGINLTASDIEGNESTFICRMYDDDFNFVNAIGATVKIALEGKSAYEQAVENGYEGTEEEWIDSLKGTDGKRGVPGKPGEDGTTTYTWVRYADTPTSGMNNFPEGKKYIGLAFNKTTQTESNNYNDYQWSLMPQNIEVGGRNLIRRSLISSNVASVNTSRYVAEGVVNITTPGLTAGARITAHPLLPNTEYVMRYRYRKTSGTLVSFGGHTDATWSNNRTYVDGKYTGNHHSSSSAFVADDNAEHEVVVYISTPSTITDSDYIYIQPNRMKNSTASLDIYDWKLEKGNTATDWTPAPEDVQSKIDEKAAQIDFDTVLSEQAVALDKIEALNTEINATKDNLIISHSAEYIEKIEKVLGSSEKADARLKVLDEQRVQIETYFQFDDAFTIGRSNSKNKVRITNEQMQFLDGETILAYASGNYFFIKNMKVEQALEVGVHKIEEENGITVGRFIGG